MPAFIISDTFESTPLKDANATNHGRADTHVHGGQGHEVYVNGNHQ